MRRLITRLAILGVVLLIAAAIPGTRAHRNVVCNPMWTEYNAAVAANDVEAANRVVDRYTAAGCQPD